MKQLQYYATEQLGPKRRLTPEGFLLCEEVPIARTGLQLYGDGEVPVPADAEGHIHVERHPEDVFRPETVTSFNGKPVVNGHPMEDVGPANWRELAVGTVMNPRRAGDYILAEMLIYNKDEIEAVNAGLREVSCGYDADYIQLADAAGNLIPGRAKQVNIMGNHVALVEAGRCGPRCAIGDAATIFVRKPQRRTIHVWLEEEGQGGRRQGGRFSGCRTGCASGRNGRR